MKLFCTQVIRSGLATPLLTVLFAVGLMSVAGAQTVSVAPFHKIKPDPAPKSVLGAHYVISNELNHHIFRPHIKELGGTLVGVGTDQLFLFAGWAKPEVLVPLDFDSVVVDIHRIYGVLFNEFDTPAAFLAAFDKKNATKTRALITTKIGKTCKRCPRLFRIYRKKLLFRLNLTKRAYTKRQVPTFLTDQESYDFVAKLHRDGRVFPTRGDLRKNGALLSVSQAAREAGLPIRALYLSNAEQYFKYDKPYIDNIAGLFTDTKSLILRTDPRGKKGTSSNDYWYFIQKVDHFQNYLQKKRVLNTKVYGLIYPYKSPLPDTNNRGFRLDR